MEKVRTAVRLFRERRPELPADGELQGDAALIADIARRKAPDSELAGRANDLALAALFNEELGALLQIRVTDRQKVMDILRASGLGECRQPGGYSSW